MQSLLKHENISVFISAISRGGEFNIFSELAEMDLQRFLDGEHSRFHVTPTSILDAVTRLAHGLAFLHRSIYLKEGPVSCLHLDIKPENILIFHTSEPGVGIWKFTDFGISRIKLRSEEQYHPRKLKRSLCSSSSQASRTNAKRPSGTWQGPEVHSGDDSGKRVVGTESDVWSFVCILVHVFALMIGPEQLKTLTAIRGKTIEGMHYDSGNGDRFYWQLADGTMVLNPHVEKWANKLLFVHAPHLKSQYLLPNCHSIIFSGLVMVPKDRINASDLHQRLHSIFTNRQKPIRRDR